MSLFFCYTIYTDGNNFITVSKTSEESRILSKNLYTNKFFKGLDRDVHDTIHSVMHRHSFIAGEKMFTKEDMFFCIVAGSCHVVQQGIGAVVDLVSKGKSFGMFLFFFLQYIARYSRQYIARYSRLGILGSVFSARYSLTTTIQYHQIFLPTQSHFIHHFSWTRFLFLFLYFV